MSIGRPQRRHMALVSRAAGPSGDRAVDSMVDSTLSFFLSFSVSVCVCAVFRTPQRGPKCTPLPPLCHQNRSLWAIRPAVPTSKDARHCQHDAPRGALGDGQPPPGARGQWGRSQTPPRPWARAMASHEINPVCACAESPTAPSRCDLSTMRACTTIHITDHEVHHLVATVSAFG